MTLPRPTPHGNARPSRRSRLLHFALPGLLLAGGAPALADPAFVVPTKHSIRVMSTTVAPDREVNTVHFDIATSPVEGLKIRAEAGSAVGAPRIDFAFRAELPQIVEFTQMPPDFSFVPGVTPVVRTYPEDFVPGGRWAWQDFVELTPPGTTFPRLFSISTTDGFLSVLVTISPASDGIIHHLNEIKWGISLDLSVLGLPVDNSIAFVGEMTSSLEYNHLIDQNGNNVYDCGNGDACFGAQFDEVLICNGGPIVNMITGFPSVVSPGKVAATASVSIWSLDFANIQPNPPPSICTWDP